MLVYGATTPTYLRRVNVLLAIEALGSRIVAVPAIMPKSSTGHAQGRRFGGEFCESMKINTKVPKTAIKA